MNDPIAWRRAELERRRNRALARAKRKLDMGAQYREVERDLQAVDSCQRELATLALLELSSVGEDDAW